MTLHLRGVPCVGALNDYCKHYQNVGVRHLVGHDTEASLKQLKASLSSVFRYI